MIRLRLGSVEYKKRGAVFSDHAFEDGSYVQWACVGCTGADPGLLKMDWCTLCNHQFFPEESVVLLDIGDAEVDKGRMNFYSMDRGLGHYMCVCEDMDVPLFKIPKNT